MAAPNAGEARSAQSPRPVRERILRATLRLVADQGVDAVTHRAVAGLARVSPGSTTHHFASRDALLQESFRYYLREAESAIRALIKAPADRGGDPTETVLRQLRAIVDPAFNFGLTRAEYELFLFACTDDELAADVRAWEQAMVALLAEELERAGAERPVTTARTLLNLVRGYELERLIDPRLTPADFDDRVGPFLRALLPPAR